MDRKLLVNVLIKLATVGKRDNILNGNFRNIGLEIAQDADDVTYWCMVLGNWSSA